jgi:predicted ArsR family transcriptional regulator
MVDTVEGDDMDATRGNERFFASTRGRVVTLLRRKRHTVDELAGELDLTDNAIRAHLAALERDGLVRQGEMRRGGVGKPSFTYELTPEAEHLFPKAYGVLLQQLLGVLAERLPCDVVTEALREVGHRLAAGEAPAHGDLRERVERARSLLGNMGGLAEVTELENGYVIEGCSCPLATAVEGHPDTCLLAEALLTDLAGVPVLKACDPGPPPRCRFEVPHTGQ